MRAVRRRERGEMDACRAVCLENGNVDDKAAVEGRRVCGCVRKRD